MKRWRGWVSISLLLLICAVALIAYGNPTKPQSLDERTRAVASQLRCLVCAGETVADSSSGFSSAIRADIRRRLAEGQSPDQIKAFLVSKYTDAILLAPPQSGVGDLAWIAPPLLVFGGLALLALLIADWRRKGHDPPAAPGGRARSKYLERVRRELAAEVSE